MHIFKAQALMTPSIIVADAIAIYFYEISKNKTNTFSECFC